MFVPELAFLSNTNDQLQVLFVPDDEACSFARDVFLGTSSGWRGLCFALQGDVGRDLGSTKSCAYHVPVWPHAFLAFRVDSTVSCVTRTSPLPISFSGITTCSVEIQNGTLPHLVIWCLRWVTAVAFALSTNTNVSASPAAIVQYTLVARLQVSTHSRPLSLESLERTCKSEPSRA